MEENESIWSCDIGRFYIALSYMENFIGVAFTCAYIENEKVFQIMLHIGTFAVAIGFDFGGTDEM